MKKEAFKIAVFTAGLLLLQSIIGYVSMPDEIKNFRAYLKNGTDCIYFCDSVMRYSPRADSCRENIIDLVKKSGPSFSVEVVDHPGYNMDIYYSYCRAIAESEKKPEAVLISVSLYSFSVEWMRPSYKFDLEQAALQSDSFFNSIFYRSLAAFSQKSSSMAEFMEMPVYNGRETAGRMRDFENKSYETYSDENFRKKIISRYMLILDDNNPKIKSLKKTAAVLKKSGVIPVFYIAPVDYEACSVFYGPEFMKNALNNVIFISNIIQDAGGIVLDHSRLLKKDSFAWKETMYVNEHLNCDGRTKLAKKLTEDMNVILNEKKKSL